MPLLPYLLSLRHTPAVLRRIVEMVPETRYRESVGEDRFSLVEMVCHLADSEDLFQARMRAAVEQDVPEFKRVDVVQRAQERRYAERDLHEELEAFADRRRDTVAFLEGLSDAELSREFGQSFGRMSIKEFVAVLTGHDLYHLEQASAYLGG